jgi:hypothetical protein
LVGGGDTTLHDHDGISENTTHRGLTSGNPHSVTLVEVGGLALSAASLEGDRSLQDNIDVLSGDSHAESHDIASHSDTSATGTELNTLVGGGDTTLHDHDGISENTSARHAQSHDVASHSDTSATGTELNTLVGGGDTTLHDHDGISENTTHRGLTSGNPHSVTLTEVGGLALSAASLEGDRSLQDNIDVLSGDSHAESHDIASHSDTSATGTELNTLVGGGDTTLHDHDGIDENTSARHAESHDIASHSDTSATGTELNTLVGGGDTTLHDHDGIDENTSARHAQSHDVASHSDTSATGTELNTLVGGGDTTLHDHDGIDENTSARHAQSHDVASHSDTSATGTELNTLVGGGDTTLHDHDGISENTTHRGLTSGNPHSVTLAEVGGLALSAASLEGDRTLQDNIDVLAGDSHAESHDIASHSDTSATGTELNTLTGGGDTTLHDHDGIDENTSARHAQSHDVASHSDTSATGTELNTLVGGGDTTLHDHDGIDENTSARHDESHDVASHSDTSATGTELNTLTGGGDTTLHDHDGISENTTHRGLTSGNPHSVTLGDVGGLSLSAASLEGDRTLQDNIDAVGASSTAAVSAASLEGDRSLQDALDEHSHNALIDSGETGIIYTAGGASELKYNNVSTLLTGAGTVYFYDDAASNYGDIIHDGTDISLTNRTHAGHVYLKAEQTDGTEVSVFSGDPDGSTTLFYDGESALVTSYASILVYNPNATSYLQINHAGTDAHLINSVNEGWIYLKGYDTGSNETVLFSGDPDGSVELYYNGIATLKTNDTGISVYDPDNPAEYTDYYHDTDDNWIINRSDAGWMYLSCTNASGARAEVFTGDPDGAAILFYDGNPVLATATSSVQIYNSNATSYLQIAHDAVDVYLTNGVESGHMYLSALDDEGGAHSLFKGDPDASADLFFNGAIALQTTLDGILVRSSYTTTGQVLFTGVNDFVTGAIETTATNFVFQSGADLDTGVKIVYHGATELYYNNLLALRTTADGVDVYDTSGAQPWITLKDDEDADISALYVDTPDLNLKNYNTSGHLILRGVDDEQINSTLFVGDPDGAAELYFNSVKTLSTVSDGITIARAGTDSGWLEYLDTNLSLSNKVHGGGIKLTGETTGGDTKNILWGDPDTNTAIYHGGALVLVSTANGVDIHSPTAGITSIYIKSSGSTGQALIRTQTSGHFILEGLVHGQAVEIAAENTSGDYKSLAIMEPDNAVKLYYAGLKSFSTTATGIAVWDTDGVLPILHFQNDAGSVMGYISKVAGYMHFHGSTHGDALWISCEDNGGTSRWIGLDPDIPAFYPSPDSNITLGKASTHCWLNIYADAGVTSCSDPKYKKDIQVTTLGIDFIDSLIPIAFKFKKTGKRPKNHNRVYQGLLATDVEAALQDAGLQYSDFAGLEETFDDDNERWLGLKYEQFIAPLIKASQELNTKIIEKETTIQTMQSQIENLLNRIEALEKG